MKKLGIVMNCLIVLLFNTYQLNAAWHIETVDSRGIASTSLAIDSADKVHISYYGGGDLNYATNATGSWVIEPIGCDGHDNWESAPTTSLALDSNGKVHIGYAGCYGNYITNASGSWVTESTGVGIDGISLSIDSNDKVHMIGTYISPIFGTGVFNYATNTSGSWTKESFGYEGVYSSLAVDPNNKIHISLSFCIISNLGFCRYITNASGNWVMESMNNWCGGTSLALDSNNKVHISCGSDGISYATNASGSWVIEPIEGSTGGYQSVLALDSEDKAHIAYYDATSGEIKYVTNSSGSWVIEAVDNAGPSYLSEYFNPSYLSLALDSSDKAHISYLDSIKFDLKYARQCPETDIDCDEILNDEDNCPNNYNPNQEDGDNDGIGDVCDNCPGVFNPTQEDTDEDSIGNACDLCPNDPENDADSDSICGDIDNCPYYPNSSYLGSCTVDVRHTCTDNEECEVGYCSMNQEDIYPPQGNGIGDACECEGNFNCSEDQDVDGSDASLFKADFGRSIIIHPCIAEDPCNGDFNCDGDVDGTDASLFKADFGRGAFNRPCPVCEVGVEWCQYP